MTRILIATNEPMLAKGLEAVLAAAGLNVVAMCSDALELFESLGPCRPDVTILDLPMLPGPEVIRELRALAPRCRFVLWPRDLGADELDAAVRCGAAGMLASKVSPEALVDVIADVACLPDTGPAELVNSLCSPPERELLALVGYGLNNDEIAAAMRFDRAGVHKLLKDISGRLGAEDRCELALYGLSTLNQQG